MYRSLLICSVIIVSLSGCASNSSGTAARVSTQSVGNNALGRVAVTSAVEADVITLRYDADAVFRVLPAVFVAMLAGPPTGLALGDWLSGNSSPSLLETRWMSTRLTIALAVIGTVVSIVVLSLQERLASARLAAEAAQRQAAETRLRLLHSQLEPHMLFNTLANLRVLIGIDPAAAQAMLDRLNAFLRSTLGASQAERHALAREFAWLDDYLALMRVRMGERLACELDLPGELAATPVPPLLLQPLVENAIRHGLEPQVTPGRIAVRAARDGDTLVLTVRDTGCGLGASTASAGNVDGAGAARRAGRAAGAGNAPGTGNAPGIGKEPGLGDPPGIGNAGGGFGLAQVRERLQTIYGAEASLELAAAAGPEGGTLATLRLPLARAGGNRP